MIQFRTADERAAMKKRRKHLRGMRKGVDNSRMQNRGGEYGGAITNEEQRNIQSGQEKIRSNIENIGIAAATQLATGGIANIASKGLSTGIAAAEKSRDAALAGKTAAEGLMTSAEAAMNMDDFIKASTQFDDFAAQALKAGNKFDFLTKAKNPIVNTIKKAPGIISSIKNKGSFYGVNPGAEETVEPSGPEYQYDFFTPYSFDE